MGIPALDEKCSCDKIAQSPEGIVEDGERLVRVLTDRHYNGARVENSAFRIEDIISEGISLTRLQMVNVAEFQAIGEDIRRLHGAAEVRGALAINAETLRELRNDNDERSLCVFDDPVRNQPGVRDNPAHCMAVSPKPIERVDAQQIRFHLLQIFAEARYLHELWHEAA